MFLTVVFYFAVIAFLYFIVLPKESSRVSPKKYPRSDLLKHSNCHAVPSDWVSVDSIKSSMQEKSISSQHTRPSFTSNLLNPQAIKPRPSKILKPKLHKPVSKFESNKENQVPFTKISENYLSKPKPVPEPSLSSFILKELETSMYELTKKTGHLNPYAAEFTLNNFSSS